MNELGQAAAPQKKAQIQEKLDYLSSRITATDGLVSRLTERLVSVIRGSEPSGADVNVKDPVALVPLASDLKSFGDRIADTNSALNDILDRLEL